MYNPDFYSDIKNQTTGQAVKYFFKLSLLISLALTIIFSAIAIPAIHVFTSDANLTQIISLFPADLTVTIKNGEFSTNVPNPYMIPIPGVVASSTATQKADQIQNLLVINTDIKDIPTNVLTENKTIAFMTKNALVMNKNGTLQVTTLDKFQSVNMSINQQTIHTFVYKILPYIKMFSWFLPLPIFIVLFVMYAIKLLSFFVSALVIWFILSIKKMDRGYMYAFRMTIYAQTLAILLSLVYGGLGNWLISLLITVVVVLLNMKDSNKVETPVVIPPQTH